jgi:hypothetical protein
MSSQHSISPDGRPPGDAAQQYPPCPKCSRPMTVKQVAPLLFAPDFDDITFGCEECGTRLKRTVKRA